MKTRTILITSFLLIITLELIKADKTINNTFTGKAKRFMQSVTTTPENQFLTTIITTVPTTIPKISTTIPIVVTTVTTEDKNDNNNNKENDVNDNHLDYSLAEDCKKLLKPSTTFTIILMIYMVLIIAGAILVLVLLKKDLEN